MINDIKLIGRQGADDSILVGLQAFYSDLLPHFRRRDVIEIGSEQIVYMIVKGRHLFIFSSILSDVRQRNGYALLNRTTWYVNTIMACDHGKHSNGIPERLPYSIS
jgi:hypothetical protein